jgi:hypothetical protein
MSKRPYTKRDLERNEDPEAIAGSVGGATGASIGGGLGLAALGPVGAIAGVLAGAIGGYWAGKGIQQAADEMDRSENAFRRAHEHAGASRPYEEVRHGYQLGYLAGRNPRYADAEFAAADAELRAAWVKAHAHDEMPVPWDEVHEEAKIGFEIGRKNG